MVENPYSATWMRSSAALLVVFVSDEEEQSQNFFPDPLTLLIGMRGREIMYSSRVLFTTHQDQATRLVLLYSVRDFGERYLTPRMN